MPSVDAGPSASPPRGTSTATTAAAPCGGTAAAVQLAQASRALWSATLALMAAFMHTPAPAHRLLLARRIARNFDTLSGQDCFDRPCRASFARLARRWQARADQLAPAGRDRLPLPLS